jgi:hypothetical protein
MLWAGDFVTAAPRGVALLRVGMTVAFKPGRFRPRGSRKAKELQRAQRRAELAWQSANAGMPVARNYIQNIDHEMRTVTIGTLRCA